MAAEHAELVIADGLHSSISFSYVDEAERLAAGPFGAGDLFKMAWQASTSQVYLLSSVGPDQWTLMTTTTGGFAVTVPARKNSAGSIPQYHLVYAAGYDLLNDTVLVESAQANSDSTMPCIGMALEAIDNVTGGLVRELGVVEGVDTSGLALNDQLYVSETTAGEFRVGAPTGSSNRVQPIGLVATVGGPGNGAVIIDRSNIRPLNNNPASILGLGTASEGSAADTARTDHVHPAESNADHNFQGNDILGVKLPMSTAKVDKGNVTGSVTVDWTQGRKQEMTLTGNVTSLTFTNPPADSNLILIIIQDGTGGRTVSGLVGNHFIAGGNAALSSDPNSVDRCYIEYDSDNNSYYWHEQLDYGSFTSFS